MNTYRYYMQLFWQLFKHDCFVFGKRWKEFAINYVLFCPTVYAFSLGYIVPYSGIEQTSAYASSVFFAGSILWMLYPLAFMFCADLFFDLQQVRFIDYQLTIAPAYVILAERLLFFSLATWVLLLPYYPISSWLLGSYFDTSNTSWLMLFIVLYFSSLFFVAFNLFFVFFIERIHQTNTFFMRTVYPMIQLGGLRMPLYVAYQYSWYLGTLSLFNPIMYMTEGIRQAIFHSSDFLSCAVAIGGLLVGTVVSFAACLFFFKKRVDHI